MPIEKADPDGFHVESPAASPDEVRRRHEANRSAWNEGATQYTKELKSSRDFLLAGRSNIHPIERRNLARYGSLADWCRTAIHLQCAGGRDTLSLANEGAQRVIGVDISDLMVKNARELARLTGIEATFYRCDVLEAPHELDGTADLVYTGRGALCWLHDLDAWAAVVHRLLKPGGVLSLFDGHPVQWLFREDSPTLEIADGARYFGYAVSDKGWCEQYIGKIDGMEANEESRKYEHNWTLADVVQAVIDSGLVVDVLGEHPEDFWEAFPALPAAERERIPNTFSLCARKAAAGGSCSTG